MDNLVKNVTHLALQDTHLLQLPNAMTLPLTNVATLVIRKKIVILAPVIMNVVELGNIVKVQLVPRIVPVAALIAKVTTFRILAAVIMALVMEIIETVIVLSPATRLKQTLVRMSAA